MNVMTLLEPLSMLRHSPADGFCDSPEALVYNGQHAAVRFDKTTGSLSLDPPSADVLAVFQELQALASRQHDQERAAMLGRLRKRPF